MSETSPQVIERVKKLLNLANDAGATEAEAATAMNKAQEILAAHNLTLAQLEADTSAGPAQRDKVELNGRAAYEYQRHLMEAIAQSNFCLWWLDYDYNFSDSGKLVKRPKHMLIGRIHNVVAAQNLFDYLNSTLERLVPVPHQQRLSKTAISWKEGAVARLRRRLLDRKAEMVAENNRKAQAGPATSNGVAIRLENVFEQESDANWEFRFGYAPGELAKNRAERAVKTAEATPEVKADETPAEKAQREKAEAKAQEKARKYWERYDRQQQRKWDSKDQSAYLAGMEAGDQIGLDDQIGKDKVTIHGVITGRMERK